jgi:putative restriction endonuclease
MLRYKNVADLIGMHHRVVKFALSPIQDYCLDCRFPPLTVLVVGERQVPGKGFIAWDLDDTDTAVMAVYSYDWSAVANPFKNIGLHDSKDVLVRRLIKTPDQSEIVYRLVPDRGFVQRVFREALIRVYDAQCAFCRCRFTDALEAAHIIPWRAATPAERLDVRNGILLCATHHRMFDANLITVGTDYFMQYRHHDQDVDKYSKAHIALGSGLHGTKITLPNQQTAWPSVDMIQRRRQEANIKVKTLA